MTATHKGLFGVLGDLFAPLSKNRRACIIGALALVLLLLHLIPASRAFFAAHLAPTFLSGATPLEVEWWATLYHFCGAFILFLLLPALLLKASGQNLGELGLGLGKKKLGFGLVLPIGLLLVALPAGFFASTRPDFLAEYPLSKLAASSPGRFVLYELAYGLLYYAAYEAFFRGFVQFSLRQEIGDGGAILVQTAMTTLLHLGKPDGEIVSALLAGFVFGSLALRLRSVWPLFLIHWGLGCATDLFCAHQAGILWGG